MLKLRKSLIALAFLVALAPPLGACAQDAGAPASSIQPSVAPAAAPSTSMSDYMLGTGDKLKITVFNEPTLSGDFEVSSTGVISMPLIGEIPADKHTVAQVKQTIVTRLSDGYMKSPHVNLEVMSYRPFFIIGEVMKPGSYQYVNGMSVINAVAVAGGYTYRADKDEITLKHGGLNGKEERVNEVTTVLPGDVINVPQRFF